MSIIQKLVLSELNILGTSTQYYWENYSSEDHLCSHFIFEDWHKAVEDINTDEGWTNLLNTYPQFIRCIILKDKRNDETIAFVYLLYEDEQVVSLHGAGCVKSIRTTLIYYVAFIELIEKLLSQGIKVRTKCLKENLVANRFDKSIGFKIYRKDAKRNYM